VPNAHAFVSLWRQGNLIFAMAINAVAYAWHKQYVPHMALDPQKTRKTMGVSSWEHFYEPFCPNVSAWLAACPNVQQRRKPLHFW